MKSLVLKTLILSLFLFAGSAFAQCGAYANFSPVGQTIQTNPNALALLNTAINAKLNIQCGSGTPSSLSLACTASSDVYVNTANGNFYVCTTTGNPGTWTAITGGNSQSCGTTATCAATAVVGHFVFGSAPLVTGSPSTVAITGISPAFTSASTYSCTVNDQTTRTNQVVVLAAGYVSGSAFTITGPNTVTDVVNYTCFGY